MEYYGKTTLSEEHKRKISESSRGRSLSEEHKRKISESNKGRVVSEKTREKIRQSKKGKCTSIPYTRTEEHRTNISKARMGNIPWNKGKRSVYSKETLLKMRLSAMDRMKRTHGNKFIPM